MTADGRLSRVGRAVQGRDGGGRKGAGAALAVYGPVDQAPGVDAIKEALSA